MALRPFGTTNPHERAFREFHRKHPEVYDALVWLARDLVKRGHTQIGIGMLYEVVRWEKFLSNTHDDFKLNNNYRAYYARLIMKQEEDLRGIFETRRVGAI